MIVEGLERACHSCNGSGVIPRSDDGNEPCDDCEATGVVLTDEGKRLLRFLRKHLPAVNRQVGLQAALPF